MTLNHQNLVFAGTVVLAVGAVMGWPVALLSQARVTSLRWLREPRRLLQLHIDFILMGLLLIVLGTALPHLPLWTALLVLAGAIANPLLFVPLAVHGTQVRQRLVYQLFAVASFTMMSTGLIATAVFAAG